MPAERSAVTSEELKVQKMPKAPSQPEPETSDLPPAADIPSKRDMTPAELTAQEQIIERGQQTFVEVGMALLDIRDRRGYRFEYRTFEEYCRKRWDFGRIYAHRLIEAAEIAANLLPMGNKPGNVVLKDPATWLVGAKLPENERQTRPLAGLEPEQQREAWKRAVETAPDGKITAAHVERVVGEVKRSEPKSRVDWSDYALSASEDETQIIKWIMDLYNAGQPFDLDPTYGTGHLWRGLPAPRHRSDLTPQTPDCEQADARHLRFSDASLDSILFDPPFLAKDTTEREPNGIMETRFGGFKTIAELWQFYEECLREFSRVLRPGGVVTFKCQDGVSGGKQYLSHVFIINAAERIGFLVKDLFVLVRKNVIWSPSMQRQRHARKNHVYFLVMMKQV